MRAGTYDIHLVQADISINLSALSHCSWYYEYNDKQLCQFSREYSYTLCNAKLIVCAHGAVM